MAQFDVFQTGFNNCDETINFGKRAIADKSLYEISTLAVIRSSSGALAQPAGDIKVSSYYEPNGRLFLAINNCLRIIHSLSLPEVIATIETDTIVETISVSSCGNFLLMCTLNGEVVIKDISSLATNTDSDCDPGQFSYPTVFTETVDVPEDVFNVFVKSHANGDTFYFVTSRGLIKRISCIDSKFHSEVVHDFSTCVKMACFAFPFLCFEGKFLYTINLLNGDYDQNIQFNFSSLLAVGGNFIGYDQSHDPHMISADQCMVSSLNEQYPQLVTSYKCTRIIVNGQKRFIGGITGQCIQMVSINDSTTVYEIPVEDSAHLISTASDCDEMIFLLETKNSLLRPELRLQYVTEGNPELRVKRMIQQGLLEKAEEFAKTFNVNPDLLAEAKAEYLLESGNLSSAQLDEVLGLLDSTPNLDFRLHCCEYITCDEARDIRRVLSYAAYMDINVRDCRANDCNPLLYRKRKFNLILHRFDTFMSVYGVYNSAKWEDFIDCDLIDEIKLFLRKGEPERAALMFGRLDPSDIEGLTKERILEITSILDRMANDRGFVDIFVPLTLKHNPFTLMTFVEWVQSRVYHLEKSHNDEFPECAIKFLEDITSVMNPYIPTDIELNGNCRETLTNLLVSLKNIELLANNCFIKLPLSEYLCEPEDLVRNLLNLNMESECLELLLKKFLYPFMLERGVDPDELLEEEMTNILYAKEECWVDLLGVVLKFMCNIDKKLQLIMNVLKNASKPWSDKVRKITRFAFEVTTSNPLADNIRSLLSSEKQLVVMEKYEISQHDYMVDNDKSCYYRRILYASRDNLDQAIEDIHEICNDDEERFQAHLVVVLDLILEDNLDKALELVNSLKTTEKKRVAFKILGYLMSDISYELMPREYQTYCYNALKPIYNCCLMNAGRYDAEHAENMYRYGKAIYEIFRDFQIRVNSQHLQGRLRDDTLQTLFIGVGDMMLENDTFSFDNLLSHCRNFSLYFQYPLDTILQKFMAYQTSSKFFIDIGEHCLQLSRSSDVLTECAIHLFKMSKDAVEAGHEETFLDVIVAKKTEAVDDLDAVRLARKLCIKALMNASIRQEKKVLQTLQWINSCYYLSEIKPITHTLSQNFNIYLDRQFSVSMSCESIRTLFSNYLTFLKNPSSVSLQEEFKRELEEFIWSSQRLMKQEQYLSVAVKVKMLIHCHTFHHQLPELVQPLQKFLLERVLPELIHAVLSQNNVDKMLLFNLMLQFGNKKCEKLIHKYLVDYKKRPEKLSVVSHVGLMILNSYQVEHGKSDLWNIFNLCKWWFKIGEVEMKYETYFSSKADVRLEGLIREGKIGLDDVVEFSGDFGLDLQDCYMKYLEITLTSWQPDMEIINQIDGSRTVNIKNSDGTLMSTCLKAVEKISDKNRVFKLTEQIWPMINFYYYEVCLVILDVHRKTSPATGSTISLDNVYILFFLKTYNRVSKPSRSEIEQWYGNFPCEALIDPLSEFRLPLTNTFWSNDIWDIIKPEVNLDTYKKWFRVTLILKKFLTEQDICTYAINSPLANGVIMKTCDNWELSLKYEYLLPKVDQCAAHIKDLERATAAVYTLMCGMPPGADKVQMAELSYKYAKMYKESKPDDPKVEKVYIKVKQRYLNYSAIHILHKYQLGEEKYFKQVAQPSELIWELCNDARIDMNFDNVIFKCPSINKAVDEICSLFGLSVKKETINVLLRLLKYTSSLDLHSRRNKGKENRFLKRACYLCQTESNNWPKVLMDLGSNLENDLSLRANALRCLRYIYDPDNIASLSNMCIKDFSIYLDKLQVLAKMSELGMKFDDVQQLDRENRKRILKNLAKISQPLAIKCIASLCKIYGFDDLQYWDYIINSAIQMNMYRELQDYLEFLQGRCMSSCIITGWGVILSNALSDISAESQISVAEISLLLQTCPVIYELEVDRFIQKCEIAKRPDIAGILRKFSKPQ